MEDSQLKRVVEMWANDPYIEHEDVTKCGTCLRQKIQSEVATEMLKDLTLDSKTLIAKVSEETTRRFEATELYIRIQELLNQGQKIEDIAEDLLKEGIEI